MRNKILYFLVLAFLLFIPNGIFAKEYNKFDIRFEEELGTNVKNNEIKVYVSVDENEELVDHTEDFTMEDVKWYKYKSSIEDGKTLDDYDYTDEEANVYGYLVSDDDVFEEEYKYFLVISSLKAQEEDTFYRNVTINGVDIDELQGQCFNSGNDFFIKTVTIGTGSIDAKEDEEVVAEPINEENQVLDASIDNQEKTCMFGLSMCCSTFLGISICIWILIALLLIILIIVISMIKSKLSKE